MYTLKMTNFSAGDCMKRQFVSAAVSQQHFILQYCNQQGCATQSLHNTYIHSTACTAVSHDQPARAMLNCISFVHISGKRQHQA